MITDFIIIAITAFFMTFVFVCIIFLFARRQARKRIEKFERELDEKAKRLSWCIKEK